MLNNSTLSILEHLSGGGSVSDIDLSGDSFNYSQVVEDTNHFLNSPLVRFSPRHSPRSAQKSSHHGQLRKPEIHNAKNISQQFALGSRDEHDMLGLTHDKFHEELDMELEGFKRHIEQDMVSSPRYKQAPDQIHTHQLSVETPRRTFKLVESAVDKCSVANKLLERELERFGAKKYEADQTLQKYIEFSEKIGDSYKYLRSSRSDQQVQDCCLSELTENSKRLIEKFEAIVNSQTFEWSARDFLQLVP